jgi:hypothetical protein
VFTLIGDRQLTGEELAKSLNGAHRGVQKLLDALAAMALFEETDNLYANTPSGKTFLAKDSAKYLGRIIIHRHYQVEPWTKLDQAAKSGQPARSRSSVSNEEWREDFLMRIKSSKKHNADLAAAR